MSPTLRRRLSTAAYYAAFLILGSTNGIIGPTLPGLARKVGVPLADAGFIITARMSGYFLGTVTAGRIYDRSAGHRVEVVALAAMALALVCIPLSPLFALVLALQLALGVAEGFVDVGGNTLLTWLHADNLGPFMNGLHFFFGAGAFVSPLITARVLEGTESVTWSYWALALAILPVAGAFLALPSPSSQTEASVEKEGGGNTLLVWLVAAFFFLYAGAELGFGGWIAGYTVAQGLGDEVLGSRITSLFYGGLTLGRLVGIPLATRLRPLTLLSIDLAGSFAGLGVLLLGAETATTTAVGGAILGLFMGSIFPTVLSLAERRLVVTGRMTSRFLAGVSLGVIVVPTLISRLIEPFGPGATLVAILVDLGLAALVFVALTLQE